MKVRIKKEWPLYIAFFLITLSWSKTVQYSRLENMFEYSGLFLILAGIYLQWDILKKKRSIRYLVICMFFFSAGLVRQDLELMKIIQLIASMFILASIALVPCKYLNSLETMKNISKSIILGSIVSTFLALFTGQGIVTGASEGILINFGFDAGIAHKNYFSYMIFCVFVTYYLSYKISKRKKDGNICWFAGLLILMTNSRSSLIILLVFLIVSNVDKIKEAKHKISFFMILIVLALLIAGPQVIRLLSNYSETFHFRINGLSNYMVKYAGDLEHLIFGNAEMAFRNSGFTYDENIRSVVGWDGSAELVILNVLIKNGLLGFVGYFVIFKENIRKIKNLKNDKIKIIDYAILISFIISAFVESYMADINQIYTIYIYLLICNIESMERRLA